jgi:hypothetical protein
MSLNARLDPAGLVLRAHRPLVSRWRLLTVGRSLARLGIGVADQTGIAPTPLSNYWCYFQRLNCAMER